MTLSSFAPRVSMRPKLNEADLKLRKERAELFESYQVRLNNLELSPKNSGDATAQGLLLQFRQLAESYVNLILDFIHQPTGPSAMNLYKLESRIKSRIRKAQEKYPEEPAFARTSKRPEHESFMKLEKAEKAQGGSLVEHVGTIFNSMFATFGTLPSYKKYEELQYKIAAIRNDMEQDRDQLLKRLSRPNQPLRRV